MSIAAAWSPCLAFFGAPLVIGPSPDQLSGDARLLVGNDGGAGLHSFGNGRAATGELRSVAESVNPGEVYGIEVYGTNDRAIWEIWD
jgi:hypothetical protein